MDDENLSTPAEVARPTSLSSARATLPASSEIDDLIQRTSNISLGPSSTAKQDPSPIEVISTPNEIVSADRIIKVKTRSQKNASYFNWTDATNNTYLSSTAHVFLGIHDGKGRFIKVERRSVDALPRTTGSVDRVIESVGQETFNRDVRVGSERLAEFIPRLRDLLANLAEDLDPGEKPLFSLVCRDGKLSLYRRLAGPCLPAGFMEVFSK
jgi:hypothetical protein